MWPFAKRGTRLDIPPTEAKLAELPDDLGVFERNDVSVKIWLPEKLTHGLDRLSYTRQSSRPDVMRWILFEHAYGRLAMDALIAWKTQRDAQLAKEVDARGTTGVRFSTARKNGGPPERTINAQLLGKSTEDFRLWMPRPLKLQLESLATLENLGLSDYLRKSLVRALLGETFHHRWRSAVGKLPDEVLRFEAEADA